MAHIGNRRKSAVSDEQIVKAYQETHSVYQVERDLGVAATTIYRVLERNGIERVGLHEYRHLAVKFPMELSLQIRTAFEAGASYADLVAKFGGTFYSIKKAILRAGGTLVSVCPPCDEEEVAKILEMHKQGISQMKISLALKRSQSFIARVFRRQGIASTRTSGPAHPMWTGGRHHAAGGYIRVKLNPDDPYYAMANVHGYVLEHRLIMARKIGRDLFALESVHHINGNPSDNRPENLQLRYGNHGKGSVLCCLNCGSRNIGHAPIGAETVQ
jgi:hypothetical protein